MSDRVIVRHGILVAALLATLATGALADPTTADEVLSAARAVSARVKDKTSRVEMRIRSPSGEVRVRTLKGFEKRTAQGRKLLWLFDSPAELAGTAFLAWQQPPLPDEMWVYLPGQRRVRRISPDLRHEQFQGSTFTYEDLTTVFYLDYEGTHTLRGSEPCGEHRCHVVETALPPERFAYQRLRTWIRDDDHLPEQIDLSGGRASKRMHVRRSGNVEGVPTILEVEMESHDGYRTTVEFSAIDYDSDLPDELFTVGYLSQKGQ